ncbi:MAG: hypothetical protein AAGD25_24555 [Cyanobacteria bacterium P01_F01_bin.150]
MTEQPNANSSILIRHSEILRQQVLDHQTLEALGRVETLWMYPQVNRVLGIVCKPGWFGPTRLVVKLPQVKSVKTHVLVQGVLEETVVNKVQQLESLIGTEVWSEGGEQIGLITDCLFDLSSGVIIRYLMVLEGQVPAVVAGVTDGIYLLSPKQIKSFSHQRVLIADETVHELRLYSEGLRLKLTQLSSSLKQDYWQGATEEWESFSTHIQSIAVQARQTLLTLAEKARDKAQTISRDLSQTLSKTMAEPIEQSDSEQFSDHKDTLKDLLNQDEHNDREHSSMEIPSQSPIQRVQSEADGGSQQHGEPDIIQASATSGDVFDWDDWDADDDGIGSKGDVGATWDEPAPWDDWDEDSESVMPTRDSKRSSSSDLSGTDKDIDSDESMDDPWIT